MAVPSARPRASQWSGQGEAAASFLERLRRGFSAENTTSFLCDWGGGVADFLTDACFHAEKYATAKNDPEAAEAARLSRGLNAVGGILPGASKAAAAGLTGAGLTGVVVGGMVKRVKDSGTAAAAVLANKLAERTSAHLRQSGFIGEVLPIVSAAIRAKALTAEAAAALIKKVDQLDPSARYDALATLRVVFSEAAKNPKAGGDLIGKLETLTNNPQGWSRVQSHASDVVLSAPSPRALERFLDAASKVGPISGDITEGIRPTQITADAFLSVTRALRAMEGSPQVTAPVFNAVRSALDPVAVQELVFSVGQARGADKLATYLRETFASAATVSDLATVFRRRDGPKPIALAGFDKVAAALEKQNQPELTRRIADVVQQRIEQISTSQAGAVVNHWNEIAAVITEIGGTPGRVTAREVDAALRRVRLPQ